MVLLLMVGLFVDIPETGLIIQGVDVVRVGQQQSSSGQGRIQNYSH